MKSEVIEIKEEFIRLDSLMKFSGMVATGGEAKVVETEEGKNGIYSKRRSISDNDNTV